MKDYTNKRYGFLTVKERLNEKKNGQYLFRCECDCGNVVNVPLPSLTGGNTKSCGCLKNKILLTRNRKENKYEFYSNFVIGIDNQGKEFIFDKDDYPLIKDYY